MFCTRCQWSRTDQNELKPFGENVFFWCLLMMISGQVVMPYDDHSVEDTVQTTHLFLCVILRLLVYFFLSTEGTVHSASRHRPFGPRLQHQMDKTRTFKPVKEREHFLTSELRGRMFWHIQILHTKWRFIQSAHWLWKIHFSTISAKDFAREGR